jgi:hypothetical protein
MPNESDRVEPRQEAGWKSMEFRRPNWVDYYLLARGLEDATEQLQLESDKHSAAVSVQLERSRQAAQASQAQYAARSEQDRVAGVRVMGVSAGVGKPLVLVNLGTSNLYEADAEICRQAAAWLGRDVSGMVLRVQRHRGAKPALDSGELACR